MLSSGDPLAIDPFQAVEAFADYVQCLVSFDLAGASKARHRLLDHGLAVYWQPGKSRRSQVLAEAARLVLDSGGPQSRLSTEKATSASGDPEPLDVAVVPLKCERPGVPPPGRRESGSEEKSNPLFGAPARFRESDNPA